MRTLDHVMMAASDRPLEKIHPSLRDALRMGIFQLLEVQPAGGRVMEADAWLRGQGARVVSK